MEQNDDIQAQRHEPERLRRRIDKMVRTGRITSEEAERVRAAAASGDPEHAIREIQLRHARKWVDESVRDGRMTQDEADLFLKGVENGEHPRVHGQRRR